MCQLCLLRWLGGKEPACRCRGCEFDHWLGKIPWRRKCHPTAVLLPGKIPWTEDPGRLQSIGSPKVGHNLVTGQQQCAPHCSKFLFLLKIVSYCWWECKLVQLLWRTLWSFLKKLEIELLYDPAIPLLAYTPRKPELKETHVPQCSS